MAWAQVKKKKKKNPTQIMTCAPAYGLGTSKKKKKPYADYDLRPRPMAWVQVNNMVELVSLWVWEACGIVDLACHDSDMATHYHTRIFWKFIFKFCMLNLIIEFSRKGNVF